MKIDHDADLGIILIIMKKIETEVCAYSYETCLSAAAAGATRVELCASWADGGVSPSAGAVRLACGIPGIEVGVMVRPRGGDFVYDKTELEQMMHDIDFAREAGADGVVLGILLPDGRVDVDAVGEMVRRAAPMEVTFHRAFDMTVDRMAALEDVIKAGCRRILTSGGHQTAAQGISEIEGLVEAAAGRIEIMAGSGVNPGNAEALLATGVDALHFSVGRMRESAMRYRNPDVALSMPGIPEYENQYSDRDTIKSIVEITDKYNKV